MRFFAPVFALFAAVAVAQNSTGQANAPSIPPAGLAITAGSNTISWTNPSSGTVTIKLQKYGGVTTPTDGIVVASGIPASAGTATISVPANEVVAGQAYVVEIIDDSGVQQPNYSTPFQVSGATGSATSSGTSTATVTSTATDSSTSGTSTGTSTSRTSSRTTTGTSSATTSPTGAPNSQNTGNKMSGAQGGLFAFIAAMIAIL